MGTDGSRGSATQLLLRSQPDTVLRHPWVPNCYRENSGPTRKSEEGPRYQSGLHLSVRGQQLGTHSIDRCTYEETRHHPWLVDLPLCFHMLPRTDVSAVEAVQRAEIGTQRIAGHRDHE